VNQQHARAIAVATIAAAAAPALAQQAGPVGPAPAPIDASLMPEEFTLDAMALGVCPDEPPLENFSLTGSVVSVPGFNQGEECAVILNAPANHYPIEILKIRVGWSSVNGGLPDSLEDALRIYPAGLPNPGPFQFEVLGPVLIDGGINEFDITTGGTGSRIVNGGPFTVSLRIANTQTPADPAPFHDANGCQPGKNAVLVNGAVWADACALGVSGDWVMGVVYRRVNCGPDCNGNGIDDPDEIAANPALDCDLDGVLDSCQIAANPALDLNNNGVLDSCEAPLCPADISGDGVVDGLDISFILNVFGPCPPLPPCREDLSGDGVVDGLDISFVLNAFGPCP